MLKIVYRSNIPFFVWTLATPVVFYSGYPILRLAWQAQRNRFRDVS